MKKQSTKSSEVVFQPKYEKRIPLQPKERPDMTLPYPYFIDEKGGVGRQDFWKGKPLRLQGFNPRNVSGVVKGTIGLEDFLKNPKRAIGMFPIFEHKGGAFFTYGDPIQTITVK